MAHNLQGIHYNELNSVRAFHPVDDFDGAVMFTAKIAFAGQHIDGDRNHLLWIQVRPLKMSFDYLGENPTLGYIVD